MSVDPYARVRANLAAMATDAWPADRLGRIVDAHEAGKSFVLIARAVGGGASKNACIGQARRIGLPFRDSSGASMGDAEGRRVLIRQRQAASAARDERRRLRAAQREQRAAERAEHHRRVAARKPDGRLPPVPAETRRTTALALTLPPMAGRRISDLGPTQCKFPIGDPRDADFAFCGRLKREDGPYCTGHHAVAFNLAATTEARRNDRKLERFVR